MNKTLKAAGIKILTDLLSQCTEDQCLVFKRMYDNPSTRGKLFPKETTYSYLVNYVIVSMDDDKIDHAITQVENTLFMRNVFITKINELIDERVMKSMGDFIAINRLK